MYGFEKNGTGDRVTEGVTIGLTGFIIFWNGMISDLFVFFSSFFLTHNFF